MKMVKLKIVVSGPMDAFGGNGRGAGAYGNKWGNGYSHHGGKEGDGTGDARRNYYYANSTGEGYGRLKVIECE